jgi:hypothetical protein
MLVEPAQQLGGPALGYQLARFLQSTANVWRGDWLQRHRRRIPQATLMLVNRLHASPASIARPNRDGQEHNASRASAHHQMPLMAAREE